jgi:hypothetical protein
MTKTKRVQRLHSLDRMRAVLLREIRDSGMSHAQFARTKLKDSPEALSLILSQRQRRGLSRKAQAYLGVKRVIMYQTK